MTEIENFIPAEDPTDLTKRTAAAMVAVANLMELVVAALPENKLGALDDILRGGGRVGLEFTVDWRARNHASLVAVEREGVHRTLATIAMPQKEIAH